MGGYARILKEDHAKELEEETVTLLDRIQENAGRMGLLIDGLLDLSRVARASIEREDVNLSALAQETIASIHKRLPDVELEAVVQPNLHAYADPRLMENVLQNLIENAWKFSHKTDKPRIEVGKDGEAFFVRDNGAGFEQEYAHKLFGAFERLHSASEYPGTGIGLATVRRIIERHGGEVWAKGRPGEGATFYFTVPASVDQSKKPAKAAKS
jgi:light-regulated signal transduction histidine kinase (bacteriophytochrome)